MKCRGFLEKNALSPYSEVVANIAMEVGGSFIWRRLWKCLCVIEFHLFCWLLDPRKIAQPILVCFLVYEIGLLISFIYSAFWVIIHLSYEIPYTLKKFVFIMMGNDYYSIYSGQCRGLNSWQMYIPIIFCIYCWLKYSFKIKIYTLNWKYKNHASKKDSGTLKHGWRT